MSYAGDLVGVAEAAHERAERCLCSGQPMSWHSMSQHHLESALSSVPVGPSRLGTSEVVYKSFYTLINLYGF
jgi:hypothetical protein